MEEKWGGGMHNKVIGVWMGWEKGDKKPSVIFKEILSNKPEVTH